MPVTIAVVTEHEGAPWWSAARAAKKPPRALAPLLSGSAREIQVPAFEARSLRKWCAGVSGWRNDRAPLAFVGLVGRPPSARRSGGGTSVLVRLSASEHATLTERATARGQSVPKLLVAAAAADGERASAQHERDTRALQHVRKILDVVEATRVRIGDDDSFIHQLLVDAMTAATLIKRDLEDALRDAQNAEASSE